jgi:hypothetical protein
MKTFLKFTSLFTAACIPSGFAVELAGFALPAALEPLAAFSAFVASLVALSLCSDYARPRALPVSTAPTAAPLPKAVHALAA